MLDIMLLLLLLVPHFIHTFVNKYQGCFRDGSYWGHDLWFFAGLYFALRIVFAVVVTSVSLHFTHSFHDYITSVYTDATLQAKLLQ